ncbi:MAG: hypothetical protein ACW967_01345 [Candidatus Hodarchaeales archaeon]|jgi:heme/copper-type cytochrome/quinol oxidase subunit 2
MKQKQKVLSFLIITLFLVSSFGILIGSASVNQVFDGREITETDPIILKVDKNFEESSIDSVSSDFQETSKFEIESQSSKIFTIFWEHNGTHLHVFLSTDVPGYIAFGWRADKPEVLSGSVMENTNIIIGQDLDNGTQVVRDDFGTNGNHAADVDIGGTDDITFSSIVNDGEFTSLEFVYPLQTDDVAETNNGIKSDLDLSLEDNNWAYFIVSASESSNTEGYNIITGKTDEIMMLYHGENRHVISKPVYLQKDTEAYPESLQESSNIIVKPGAGGEDIDLIGSILGLFDPVFGNLVSDDDFAHAVIPITAMLFFLVFIGAGFVYLVINARKQKWNLSSTLIPIVIIGVFILAIFVFPLPRLIERELPDADVDVQIVIEAQIKPWTFNATVYQNKALDQELADCLESPSAAGKYTCFVDPEEVYAGQAYAENQLIDPALRTQLGVDYLTDADYGGLKTTAFTIFYGQTVRFVMKALDTEHGFVLGAEAEPLNDIFGDQIVKTLPQHELLEVYWQAPMEDFSVEYRCSFFCGAGHAGMFASLQVIAPPSNLTVI